MDISLKDRIVRWMRNVWLEDKDKWVSGTDVERECLLAGYKASNGSRRLRELVNEGFLLRKDDKGYVEYQYKQ